MYLQAMETVSKAGHILTAMPGLGPGTGGAGGVLIPGPVTPFGSLAPAATISGRVWLDSDADGVQDGGELGIAGVTVALQLADGSTLATVTTDAAGAYSFTVEAGSYRVSFSRGSYLVSPQDVGSNDAVDSDVNASGLSGTFTASGGAAVTVDCGLYQLASVSGVVWFDGDEDGQREAGEAGLSGATVTLKTAAGATVSTATTPAGGAYSFTNLLPGSYKIAVSGVTGYVPTLQNTGADATDSDIDDTGETAAFTLVSGQALVNVDAGYVVDEPDIGAEAIIDFETPLASLPAMYGVTVTYAGGYFGPPTGLPLFDPVSFSDTPDTVPRIFSANPVVVTVNDPDETAFNTVRFQYVGPTLVTFTSANPADTPFNLFITGPAFSAYTVLGPVKLGTFPLAGGDWTPPIRIKSLTFQPNLGSPSAEFGILIDDIYLTYT
jgi:hypothetical protein